MLNLGPLAEIFMLDPISFSVTWILLILLFLSGLFIWLPDPTPLNKQIRKIAIICFSSVLALIGFWGWHLLERTSLL